MAIDLRLMRYVVTVADEGGFQRAAERLHMAQPPLSRQIRDLERELGVRLFERRPTRLTEPGRVFVESARRVLAEAERALEATREAARGERGVVRLGYVPSIAYETLPALLERMTAERPGIRVLVREGGSADLDAALRDGRLDAALARGIPERAEYDRRPVRSEPLAVVVGAANPLAGREAVALSELRGQTFCFFPRTVAPASYDAVLAALRHTGEAFEVWESPIAQRRHLRLRDGDSFTVVPWSAREHPPAGTVGVAIRDELPPVVLDLVWRPATLSPSLRTLIQIAGTMPEPNPLSREE